MKMRTQIISVQFAIFLCCLFFSPLIAQEESSTSKKYIKLYSNFSLIERENSFSDGKIGFIRSVEEVREYQLGYFTPAFGIVAENGNMHEFEIARFQMNRQENRLLNVNDSSGQQLTVNGMDRTDFRLGMRYEYLIQLSSGEESSKLHTYLGLALNPFIERYTMDSQITNSFSQSETIGGLRFSIVPRMIYDLNERWFIDFNVPIQLIEVHYNFLRNNNPLIQENLQEVGTFNMEVLPFNFLFRAGIGFRL